MKLHYRRLHYYNTKSSVLKWCHSVPANLILTRSRGWSTSVDTTPPLSPATRFSIFTWLKACWTCSAIERAETGLLDTLTAPWFGAELMITGNQLLASSCQLAVFTTRSKAMLNSDLYHRDDDLLTRLHNVNVVHRRPKLPETYTFSDWTEPRFWHVVPLHSCGNDILNVMQRCHRSTLLLVLSHCQVTIF